MFAVTALTPKEAGGKGLRPTQVMQALIAAYSVGEATAWKAISEAKQQMADAFIADLPRIKAQLVTLYERLILRAEEAGDIRGAVAAGKALARVTGADEPTKHHHSGTAGVLVVGPQEDDDR